MLKLKGKKMRNSKCCYDKKKPHNKRKPTIFFMLRRSRFQTQYTIG